MMYHSVRRCRSLICEGTTSSLNRADKHSTRDRRSTSSREMPSPHTNPVLHRCGFESNLLSPVVATVESILVCDTDGSLLTKVVKQLWSSSANRAQCRLSGSWKMKVVVTLEAQSFAGAVEGWAVKLMSLPSKLVRDCKKNDTLICPTNGRQGRVMAVP